MRFAAAEPFVPRECCVVDAGADWLTLGVGSSWPAGLWEARRRPGSFRVALERAAPQAPLTVLYPCRRAPWPFRWWRDTMFAGQEVLCYEAATA